MLSLLLPIAGFLGLCAGVWRVAKVPGEYAPFVAVSLMGIVLFLSGLAGVLVQGVSGLAVLGIAGGIVCLVEIVKKKHGLGARPLVFGGLVLFAAALSHGMTFTVVDDFVFWGILGKSMVMFHHLPQADTTIMARHLTYTPGCALIHTFFHLLQKSYVPGTAYFGQAVIFISALFSLWHPRGGTRAAVRLSVAVLLFSLFAGSVFTKLQVDYLLSAFFLGGLMVWTGPCSPVKKAVVVSPPLLFLFLIKQVGAVLSLVLLVLFAMDLLWDRTGGNGQRGRALAVLAAAGLMLILLKLLWAGHCDRMGFAAFNQAMTGDRLWAALDIFSSGPVQKGVALFVQSVFLNGADRLNLPYIAWYTVVALLWYGLFNGMDKTDAARYKRILGILGGFFLLYLFMLYFLQVVVFRVGELCDHTVGMDRYMNIVFVPVVCFSFLCRADRLRLTGKAGRHLTLFLLVSALLLPSVSRIKTWIRPDPADSRAAAIALRILPCLPEQGRFRIGVVPGENDDHLGIKLLYHLLPNPVRIGPFPLDTRKSFEQALSGYDYVLFCQARPRTLAWASALAGTPVGPDGFYEIVAGPGGTVLKKRF